MQVQRPAHPYYTLSDGGIYRRELTDYNNYSMILKEPELIELYVTVRAIFGSGNHGNDKGFEASLRPDARPDAVQAFERACVPVRQRSKESPETAVLRWQLAVGWRQASGEGRFRWPDTTGEQAKVVLSHGVLALFWVPVPKV